MDVATEARDKALETGAKGVNAVTGLGDKTLDRTSSVKGMLTRGLAERAPAW